MDFKKIKKIILYIDHEYVVSFKKGKLVFEKDEKIFTSFKLFSSPKYKFASRFNILTRLLRLIPRSVHRIEDMFFVSSKGSLYSCDIKNPQLKPIFKYSSGTSNPLFISK